MDLSPTEKFSLFEKIMQTKFAPSQPSLLARFIYAKSLRYSFVFLFLLFGAYGAHIFRHDIAFFAGSLTVEDQAVQAWYIAQIVDFQWSFFIEHKGKNILTTAIHNWDIVSLKKDTRMSFSIDDKTKAEVIGPAQFLLEQTDEETKSYKMTMFYGDFVAVDSLTEQTEQNIEVALQDIVVRQKAWDKPSSYAITKRWDAHLVSNKGADLLVTTVSDTETIERRLQPQQILAIADNDVNLIADDAQAIAAIARNDISQTQEFTKVSTPDSIVVDSGDVAMLLTLEDTQDIVAMKSMPVDPEVVTSLATIVSTDTDSKTVVSPEQNSRLRSALHANFLYNDMQDIYIAYTMGNDTAYARSREALYTRLYNLYGVFGLTVTTRGTQFSDIAVLAKDLRIQLSDGFHIAPWLLSNLDAIAAWVDYIATLDYASLKDTDTAQWEWDALMDTLSARLLFQ